MAQGMQAHSFDRGSKVNIIQQNRSEVWSPQPMINNHIFEIQHLGPGTS
jgi:hypothetical protein